MARNNNRPGNNNNNNRPGNNNNRPGNNNRPPAGQGASNGNNRPGASNNNSNNRPTGNNNNNGRPTGNNNSRPGNNNNGRSNANSNRNSVDQQTKQRNANAEEWRNNPVYTKEIQDALLGHVNGGSTIDQAFYDSPEFAAIRGELTNQQIADFAKSQGYKLGDQWMKDFGTNPAQTLKSLMNGRNQAKLHELLKIAAGQGPGQDLVSKKEFNRIHNYYDGRKTGLKITDRMDAINARQLTKAEDQRFNPMGLQSDVFGRISKGKYGDSKYDQFLARYNFKHQGPLSQLAMNYEGSNLEGVKGMGVYGSDAKGNAIFSPGQGGKSWSEHKLNNPSAYVPWHEPTTTTADPTPIAPIPKPTTPVESFSSGGVGDTGEKNALTFRQNKSRWKNDGRATKGTSGLRFNRQAGFGGFSGASGLIGASLF